MNLIEVALVLARVQLDDNREIDDEGVVLGAWADTIGDLPFDEAIQAVIMHRRETTDYLTPAHVRANVKLITARQERLERIQLQRQRAALPPALSTFDRETFERETQAAIELNRAIRALSKGTDSE